MKRELLRWLLHVVVGAAFAVAIWYVLGVPWAIGWLGAAIGSVQWQRERFDRVTVDAGLLLRERIEAVAFIEEMATGVGDSRAIMLDDLWPLLLTVPSESPDGMKEPQ
jgi:hypothetical protein